MAVASGTGVKVAVGSGISVGAIVASGGGIGVLMVSAVSCVPPQAVRRKKRGARRIGRFKITFLTGNGFL